MLDFYTIVVVLIFDNSMEREIDQSIMDEYGNVSMICLIYLSPTKWSSNDLSFVFHYPLLTLSHTFDKHS